MKFITRNYRKEKELRMCTLGKYIRKDLFGQVLINTPSGLLYVSEKEYLDSRREYLKEKAKKA